MSLLPPYPILVVSYIEETRAALVTTLNNNGVFAVSCATFCEAEEQALQGLFSGMLIDLPSIIKSKGEEKIVAYTLANFFPTLRVRTMGGMLVPMAMPGSAKQDKNLGDFLTKTCLLFHPRTLRSYRRHLICLSTMLTHNGVDAKGFTLDLSWGGMFIVDLQAERFNIGDKATILLPEFGHTINAEVRNVKLWGVIRQAPGVGFCFKELDDSLEFVISSIIRTNKDFDRDRLSS